MHKKSPLQMTIFRQDEILDYFGRFMSEAANLRKTPFIFVCRIIAVQGYSELLTSLELLEFSAQRP